jgi:hypothetical protein
LTHARVSRRVASSGASRRYATVRLAAALATFVALCLAPLSFARAEERQGAVVLAKVATAERAAEGLARAAYQETLLRPALDESTVRAVLGGPLPADAPPRAAELRRVARAAMDASDPAIGARLMRGLGAELGVALVLVVEGEDAAPVARAFVVSEGRYSPVTFSPTLRSDASLPARAGAPPPPSTYDWTDAVALLRGLTRPRASLAAPPAAVPAPTEPPRPLRRSFGEHLVQSSWFWGGLAAVAAVGVTVIILSQTTLNESDTVVLGGRIAP